MRKLNIIIILFYSLKLLCQHDIYAPREDLLKKYGIKEYTKTSHFKRKGINENDYTYHKYYLNKNGKVILEENKDFNNFETKVEYKFNDADVLISKANYLNHSNNHERMYTYIYSDSMKLKTELVLDSLNNVEWYVLYNENEQPLEVHSLNTVVINNYYENGNLECVVYKIKDDLLEHIYIYENNLLKQLKNYKEFQLVHTIYYAYDENKNIISEHDTNTNGEIFFSKLYEYDREQRVTKIRKISYHMGNYNFDNSIGEKHGDVLKTSIDEEIFKYNKVGLLKELILPTSNKNLKFVRVFEYK